MATEKPHVGQMILESFKKNPDHFSQIVVVEGGTYFKNMTSVQPHIGHMLLENFKNNPDHVCQVDAATGESETNASVLRRVIRLSKYFRQLDLKPGDVITLCGRNHNDLSIPYYAGLISGLTIASMDWLFKYEEIKIMLSLSKPKIVFCQKESNEDFIKAVRELELDTTVVTFGGKECNMKVLIDSIDGDNDNDFDDFQAENQFKREEIFAWLVPTSGTTGGVLKLATFTYKSVTEAVNVFLSVGYVRMPGSCSLQLSQLHWMGGYFNLALMPLYLTTKVQTSAEPTVEHIIDIINKYRPVQTTILPSMVGLILNHPTPCDLTCFEYIILTGSKSSGDVITDLRSRVGPKTIVANMYAQSESIGSILRSAPEGPAGNCGVAIPFRPVKLVDPVTEEEITEPNKPGEMWVKTGTFSGYYNMPEETAKVLTPDGWLKTGDLLYRDENNYYFYVDRIKMLIKYKGYHIIPTELEQVISTLEGVQDVAVSCIPDEECGELPVACVVRKPGADVTADDVKHIVENTLSDSKRLRGGVVFMDTLPMTSTGKVARAKLKELVKTARRE